MGPALGAVVSSGPENKFRKRLVAVLRSKFGGDVYIQKNHGSAFSAGLVDMEVVLRGAVGFYELKASDGPLPPGSVTALQRHTLEAIERAGGRAYVLHYNTHSGEVTRHRAATLAPMHREALEDAAAGSGELRLRLLLGL